MCNQLKYVCKCCDMNYIVLIVVDLLNYRKKQQIFLLA